MRSQSRLRPGIRYEIVPLTIRELQNRLIVGDRSILEL